MLRVAEASALKNHNRLFRNGDRYRLVLRCQPGYRMKKLLDEYGAFVGGDLLALSHTFEHWQSAGQL